MPGQAGTYRFRRPSIPTASQTGIAWIACHAVHRETSIRSGGSAVRRLFGSVHCSSSRGAVAEVALVPMCFEDFRRNSEVAATPAAPKRVASGPSGVARSRHRDLELLPRRTIRRVYRLISGVTEMPWSRIDAATVVSVIAMSSSASGPGMPWLMAYIK